MKKIFKVEEYRKRWAKISMYFGRNWEKRILDKDEGEVTRLSTLN